MKTLTYQIIILFIFLLLITFNCISQSKTKSILIDEGHYNFHTINGGYSAFANLLLQNGYDVKAHKGPFNSSSFKEGDVLIIANPFPDQRDSLTKQAAAKREPFRWSSVAARSAFTTEEIKIVQNWVFNGGSLLLVLDHAPHGETGGQLALAFGVETRNVETTDSTNSDTTVKSPTLLFTRYKGLIGQHPILHNVDSVVTYLGESLLGPPSSSVLLQLPSTTIDRDWLAATREYRNRSAAGRAQGIAFEYGKGRVVILGEAGMLTSTPGNNTNTNGSDGIARADRGNKNFAINIINWLAKVNLK